METFQFDEIINYLDGITLCREKKYFFYIPDKGRKIYFYSDKITCFEIDDKLYFIDFERQVLTFRK